MKVEIEDWELNAIRQLLIYVPAMAAVLDETDDGKLRSKLRAWVGLTQQFVDRIDTSN